jgi:hypothetical protein
MTCNNTLDGTQHVDLLWAAPGSKQTACTEVR